MQRQRQHRRRDKVGRQRNGRVRGRRASQTGQRLWQESLRAEENQGARSPRCAEQSGQRRFLATEARKAWGMIFRAEALVSTGGLEVRVPLGDVSDVKHPYGRCRSLARLGIRRRMRLWGSGPRDLPPRTSPLCGQLNPTLAVHEELRGGFEGDADVLDVQCGENPGVEAGLVVRPVQQGVVVALELVRAELG